MITISFENDKREFRPGDMISGRINWTNMDADDVLTTRLVWYSKSAFENEHVIALQQTLVTEPTGMRRFMYLAPESPFSCEGKLVSVYWAIEVQFEKETISEPLTISLTGKPVVLHKSYQNGVLQPKEKDKK